MTRKQRSLTAARAGRKKTVARSNAMYSGQHGGNTVQDRGAWRHTAPYSANPWHALNARMRWQEYTRLYMTAWEARKIIDIPVEDALRKPFKLRGMDEADARELRKAYDGLNVDHQLRRALIQERLYGGCLLFPVLRQPEGMALDTPLTRLGVQKGDLQTLNLVDVSHIGLVDLDRDPFSPGYDQARAYTIDGVAVDVSRLVVLDGSPLLSYAAQHSFTGARANPAGFGESRLAPLYDILTRMIGTQQAAYHLVNLASVLMVEAEDLIDLEASGSPGLSKLRDIVEQISIYQGAVVDGRGARFSQHAASFGSVPELVMSFAQLLAAAGDVPASRFLGKIPGSLNATGEGDAENYYNTIESYQRLTVNPARLRLLGFVGASLWGGQAWEQKARDMEIHNPPLWSMSESDTAALEKQCAEMIAKLHEAGIIGKEAAVKELLARDLFRSNLEAEEFLEELRVAEKGAGTMEGRNPAEEQSANNKEKPDAAYH